MYKVGFTCANVMLQASYKLLQDYLDTKYLADHIT